jgi:hypothetical protein
VDQQVDLHSLLPGTVVSLATKFTDLTFQLTDPKSLLGELLSDSMRGCWTGVQFTESTLRVGQVLHLKVSGPGGRKEGWVVGVTKVGVKS